MIPTASEIHLPKLPLLNELETRRLLQCSQQGEVDAKDMLVKHNLRLVMSIVNRFFGRGVEEEDLFQIGCMGLIKAIDRFNLDLGVQFSTYAVPMIMGEIRQFLRDAGPIKIARSLREISVQIAVARQSFLQNNEREPTIGELQEATQLSKDEIATALEATQPITYLQSVVGEDEQDGLTLENQLSRVEPSEEKFIEGMALREVLATLDPRLKQILEMRFFAGQTQTQVSQAFGVSQVHISRLEKEALRRLKTILSE